MNEDDLTRMIVAAKAATYVGNGVRTNSSRTGSHDLTWSSGEWSYLDSYFGGTDFIGQETMWFRSHPIWSMCYYGYIKLPDLIDGRGAGETIKEALSGMYREGRFLGGYEHDGRHGRYVDRSHGDTGHFRGREIILVDGREAYALKYFGGLIRE